MNACERLLEDYTRSKEHLPGSSLPWLNAFRESAIENFAAQGLPGPRDENWKYTPIKQLQRVDYKLAQQLATASIDSLAEQILSKQLCPDEHCLVFINGFYKNSLSTHAPLPEGIILNSFSQALQHHPQLIAAELGKIANDQELPFSALNSAMISDGVFLWAAENSSIKHPIHCLFVSTTSEQPVICHPRLLLILKEHAQLTLIEHYIDLPGYPDANSTETPLTKSDRNLLNVVTEIQLSPGAQLNHYKLQYQSVNSSHIATMYIQQQRASSFTSHSYSLGAALARNDIQIKLSADHAQCSLNGVYVVDAGQHVDYHTKIEHLAPACNSRQIYKGVVQGHARAVFNGKVVIHPAAQQSNARQLNKNLLLGEQGEVDTKPELQIYADDVQCSHGATVGQLDTQALFYLRSRGISKKDAQAWLIYGFVSEQLERIDNPLLRKFIELPVITQLNQLVSNDASNLQQFFAIDSGEL
ncbi:MAG: Fe-S cluster assembly protein SufD [Photobacterium frigidiphilum]|uniref:Fe-S cluster assembly protein SufD n=1 Tax=Photobacterium frigidiphilum TaxID=264736 RepID=UPI003002D77D